MKPRYIYPNLFIILGIDILLLSISHYGAHLVRFDFNIPAAEMNRAIRILPVVLLIKLICFYFFDLYRGMWRYTSIYDLLNVIKACGVSSLFIMIYILLKYRFMGYSRSVYLIDFCFSILLISSFRLLIRLVFEQVNSGVSHLPIFSAFRNFIGAKKSDIKKLIIIGAGNCGEKIYREIHNNASLRYHVVGFLDDHDNKIGRKIHGVPILGRISELATAIKKVKADEVLIAIPTASGQQMRKIVRYCKEISVPFKTVPGYGELIDGRVSIKSIRDVAYRDLLGREVIKLDEKGIGAYLEGFNILVTGAGGSIGSELCRQICRFKPNKLILYERAESPLYEIEWELRKNFPDVHVMPVLGDIQNKTQLENTFRDHKPQTVFHAAAYKHVPMLEMQPWKAVENNIIGTEMLIDVVITFGCDRLVFVSTDKAVRPTNVMGASKRVAEMLIQCQDNNSKNKTNFAVVRFGNVVGSVGSVVPLFKKQIETGGPVTVTHPEVTRYFMTIPEASQLILQAGSLCSDRVEIFILDMGKPIKIADLARDLIRLSGFEPDVDVHIDFIGMRPGEKLYEELITEGEGIVATSHEKIMTLRGEVCSLSHINGKLEKLTQHSIDQNERKIKETLKEIVPDYQPYEGTGGTLN